MASIGSVPRFQKEAVACRSRAAKEPNAKAKTFLLRAAEQWEALARELLELQAFLRLRASGNGEQAQAQILIWPNGGSIMKHVEELLEKANKCLAMAATTGTEERKSEFKKLAQQWFELAAERRQSLEESGTTAELPTQE